MSHVTFSENHHGQMIAFEDGVALCSFRDPQSEGLKWSYSLGHVPSKKIIIVGLGSGFHVAALADVYPELDITVLETRVSLLTMFRSQFPDLLNKVNVQIVDTPSDVLKSSFIAEILLEKPYVVSFRECWGNETEKFSTIFSHATGRSLDSLKYHFVEFGIDIKSMGSAKKELLSIKDVLPNCENSSMREQDQLAMRVLGELVK
jgi:hypothetical protein